MILKNVLYFIKTEDEKEPEQKAGGIGSGVPKSWTRLSD